MKNTLDSAGFERHAITRARERLGKEWTNNDLYDISLLIWRGASVLLGSCPNEGTESHLVQYDDITFRVVYSPRPSKIVTVYAKSQKMSRGAYNKRPSGKRRRRGKHRKNRKG